MDPAGVAVSHHRILALASREPPKEIKLWNKGENPTDYGLHLWTERSAELVTAWYAKRGNPLIVDIEHGGVKNALGEALPTAGYATLDIRDGEPWLVFAWSDEGAEQIRTGQRRFLSPEYDVTKPAEDDPTKTSEITKLVRISLVADPGTHRARMLAGAKSMPAMHPTLRASLNAMLSAEDPKPLIKRLMAELEEPKEEPGEEKVKEAAPEPKDTPAEEPKKDETKMAEAEEPKKDEETEKKAASAATATVDQGALLQLVAEMQQIKAERAREVREREVTTLFASRPDFTPEVKKVLESMPIETIRQACAAFPKAMGGKLPGVPMPAGAHGNAAENAISPRDPYKPVDGLDDRIMAAMDRAQGLAPTDDPIKFKDGVHEMGFMTFAQAQAHQERLKKAGVL